MGAVSGESCAGGERVRRARAREAAVVATLVGVLMLAGCTTARSVQTNVAGWFDRTSARATAEGEPRMSYAAVDRIRVHSEPGAASPVRGVLTLHEKIRRYQTEDGFAYVEAEGDLWGWVPESQLVAQIPGTRNRPETVAPAHAAEGQPVPGEGTPGPEDAAAVDTTGQAEEEAPAPDAESPEPERSVFDPY